MNLETVAPRVGHKTLLYSELVTNLAGIQADLAVIGMPFGAAYTPRAYSNDQSNAPQALRELSDRTIVLHNGELVADGAPATVIASPVVQQAYLGINPEEKEEATV